LATCISSETLPSTGMLAEAKGGSWGGDEEVMWGIVVAMHLIERRLN
jgi:hypothetical protein